MSANRCQSKPDCRLAETCETFSHFALKGVPASEHFKAIVESSDDAIISKNLKGIVTSWNPGATRIFGYEADEIVGKPMLMLFPPELVPEEAVILAKIREGQRIEHYETQRRHKSGEILTVAVSVSPVRDTSGAVVGASSIARDLSGHKRAAADSEHFKAIVSSSEDAIISKDLSGRITSWNPGATRLFGYEESEMIGKPMITLFPPEMVEEEHRILSRIREGQSVEHYATERVHKNGTRISVSVTVSPIRNGCEQIVGASAIARDVSAQKLSEARLRLASNALMNSNDGVLMLDAGGTVIEVNEAFVRITGQLRRNVMKRPVGAVLSSSIGEKTFRNLWNVVLRKGSWRGEVRGTRRLGKKLPYVALLSAKTLYDQAGKAEHYVVLVSDVSELRTQQDALVHMAHYDALTKLPNRVLLSDRLQQAIAGCKRNKALVGILYLDLDGFKTVNDTYGHDAGDQLLVTLSDRMRSVLRDTDTLARIGGDEFVVVLGGIQSEDELPLLIQRILDKCSEPVKVKGLHTVQVSASIGCVVYPRDGATGDQLLRYADRAMYDAKQLGKNRYCIFDSGRQAEEQVRTVKITAIAEALEKGQFILYYQPKVNMLTGELVGVEALLRWNHPENGILPPDSFLPIIEGTDLARRVDEWVLEEALCQLSCWRKDGLTISMSVNVSGSYLKKDVFALRLKEILSMYPDVPRDCLELELLESSELDNITQTSEVMAQCHALGVRFAVDDFGTGYSSLLYLKKLPANTIKIDQSFIRDMLVDKEDFALVKGVVGLAQAFGRDVLAEGVETIEHGVALLQLGCTLGQGYGIARPMPAERVRDWARTWTLPECWRQPLEETN